jgi:hypothetical protein
MTSVPTIGGVTLTKRFIYLGIQRQLGSSVLSRRAPLESGLLENT